jgi:hypothetical protein
MNTSTKSHMNSRQFRQEIVGKRISGVIARPGRNGEPPMVMMLHFEDGSVVEFVSPRSDRLLKRALAESRDGGSVGGGGSRREEAMQLPLSGLAA